jgi:hypothetical protein
MSASDPDILEELALAIRQGGTLNWVLKNHRTGAPDPVQAAWATCQNGSAMREVLGEVAPGRLEYAMNMYLISHWRSADHVIGDGLPCCADVMRLAIPVGPTLDALLATITAPH